jgi:hypothetical protein
MNILYSIALRYTCLTGINPLSDMNEISRLCYLYHLKSRRDFPSVPIQPNAS